MFLVSARLVYLQFSQYDSLANRARQQQQNAIETSAQRGELLDRQGRELARSVQTVSLFSIRTVSMRQRWTTAPSKSQRS